jgi:2,4-dienoyl-CoA reductase-like NADH-dependent reductase (Old Yellow Enzyme family)
VPHLFEPLTLRGVTSRNRIWLAPMCQYAVEKQDGVPVDWHLVQLGARAVGGFGLVMTEATAVSPEGRISPQDTGLWNGPQAEAWTGVVDFVHRQGALAGVQLAHAGRKAGSSTGSPWFVPDNARPEAAWQTIGPSPVAWNGFAAPLEMDTTAIRRVVDDFAVSAARADAVGFDVIELHGAHGYLLHEFLSPITNRRSDEYGGSLTNRARFMIEVVDAVRAAISDRKALAVRVSATDWIEGGWDPEECVELVGMLSEHGVDLVDASSGGLDERQRIPVGPGYQIGFAEQIRTATGVPTGAVGIITEPADAEAIIAAGKADVVSIGRAALREPAWPLRAAHELGVPPSQAPYQSVHLRGAWRPADATLER